MEVDSSGTPTARIASAQAAAAKAEREAAERVTNAQKQIREADREAQKQLDHLRDQYEARTEAERARGENYIESVRNRTYENLTDFQRRAESEENRIARQNEQELRDTQKHYERALHEETTRGEAELKELTKKNYTASEYERKRGADELDEIKHNYQNQKALLHSQEEMNQQALAKRTVETRKADEEKTRQAIENSREHYQASYEGAVKQMRDAVVDVNWRANRDIQALKSETALKLDAYSSQKNDPFYRMVNLDAEVRENDQQFVLTARIPPHERDRININIRGNEVVISGKRRSDEILEVGPGHKQRTSSFQTFSETFPLNWPVNSKFMTREWDGDTLIVRIPKRATYDAPRPQKTVQRSTIDRPKFPSNIPTEDALARLNTPPEEKVAKDESVPPSRRKKAGSTLA